MRFWHIDAIPQTPPPPAKISQIPPQMADPSPTYGSWYSPKTSLNFVFRTPRYWRSKRTTFMAPDSYSLALSLFGVGGALASRKSSNYLISFSLRLLATLCSLQTFSISKGSTPLSMYT